MQEKPTNAVHASILSARFGLIDGDVLIPRYNRTLDTDSARLRRQVEEQLKIMLDNLQPSRLFVSVGREYWPLLENILAQEVPSANLRIATGGIGGRTSQLANWLSGSVTSTRDRELNCSQGKATLLGTTVHLTRDQVLNIAAEALEKCPTAAHRFETWYVEVGAERVAPKWLASILFEKPVALFRTADAKRVLCKLGIETKYAD